MRKDAPDHVDAPAGREGHDQGDGLVGEGALGPCAEGEAGNHHHRLPPAIQVNSDHGFSFQLSNREIDGGLNRMGVNAWPRESRRRRHPTHL
jgi:hypothetical protein